jgi:tubulin polyglutamylase TTLL4
LAQLKRYFDKVGIDYRVVMHRIKDVLIKTLISVEPHIYNTTTRCTKHRNVCFELFGFDILLDSKLKAWLLEVNISPSLSSSSPLDKKIKTVLLCDTLNLVGVHPYDRNLYQKESEMQVKKRLLGLDKLERQQSNNNEREPTLVDLINQDPNSYLCRILKHVQREVGDEKLSEDDVQIILDFEEEQHRLGNFEKIFPCINNVRQYGQFFEYPRFANGLLQKYLQVLKP